MTTITELRERIFALRLDPTDDTDSNNAMLGALVNVAEAASRYRQTVRDGELATGRRQRHDAESLDDALARLEAAK